MRHTAAISTFCRAMGQHVGLLDAETTTLLERTVDGVFEAGYQAGYADGRAMSEPSSAAALTKVVDL